MHQEYANATRNYAYHMSNLSYHCFQGFGPWTCFQRVAWFCGTRHQWQRESHGASKKECATPKLTTKIWLLSTFPSHVPHFSVFKLTVFDIQWLHFVGRGAFPNARPRRLSADVCVLELEDNNPKNPEKKQNFCCISFLCEPKKTPCFFLLGFSLRPGVERTKFPSVAARMVVSASASLLVASFVGVLPRWRCAAWSASSGSP